MSGDLGQPGKHMVGRGAEQPCERLFVHGETEVSNMSEGWSNLSSHWRHPRGGARSAVACDAQPWRGCPAPVMHLGGAFGA